MAATRTGRIKGKGSLKTSLSINLDELRAVTRGMTESAIEERARAAMTRTGHAVVRAAMKHAEKSKDTGELQGGISFTVWGQPAMVWGKVVAAAPHSRKVEYGLKPHKEYPVKGELLGWMSRHKIPSTAEGAIRAKIWREGTRAQPFLRPALRENRDTLVRELSKALDTRDLK